jgi:hypothetical protein
VGIYPITLSGASDPNYTITYINGSLNVVALVGLPPGATSVVSRVPSGPFNPGRPAQAIILAYSNLANATAAANINNYTLTTAPNSRGQVTRIRINRVVFDSTHYVVYIYPRKPLQGGKRYQLTIRGQASGVGIYTVSKAGIVAKQIIPAAIVDHALESEVLLADNRHPHSRPQHHSKK